LHSLGFSSPASVLVDQEIRDALDDSPYQIELYSESMQSILFSDPASQHELREEYIRKYRDRRPDVVIAVSQKPIKFMAEAREEFGPNTPVVICASSEDQLEGVKLDSRFTGAWRVLDAAKTLDAALQLKPATRHVVVVGGGVYPYDKRLVAIAREQLHSYESRFDFTYLTNLEMPTLLEQLKRLPAHSIVLYTAISQDAAGTRFLDETQSLPLVVGAANAPVFVMEDTFVGQGTIGGYVTPYADEGRVAGRLAVRVLNGEKPQDIPIVKDANVYMFDWRALRRWGISESILPPGSVVLDREPTFWESYKDYIIGVALLCLAETVLIFGLLWQRARRRKVEEALRQSESRFRLAAQAGRMFAYEWDAATDVIVRSGDCCEILGIDSGVPVTGREVMAKIHPDDRKKLLTSDAALTPEKPEIQVSHRMIGPDGGVIWAQRTGRAHFDQQGRIQRVVGMVANITERMQVDQALRESEERFRLAAQAGKMFAYEWDAVTDVLVRSGESLQILGIDESVPLTGQQILAKVHPDDREALLAALARLAVEKPYFKASYRMIRPDGSLIWLERTSRGQFDEQGKLLRIVGMVADIGERKRTEDALSNMSRRLIEAQEQERTRIARELHDDIGQRLALLAVELEQLRNDSCTLPEVRTGMVELQKQISEIATDIQSLSHELHSARLEYLGIAAAMRGFCKEFGKQQKAEIDFKSHDLPSPLSPEISLCLFRVLQEALHNSAKHSGVRHYEVGLWGTSNEIHLTVSDSGAGFDNFAAKENRGLGLISMEERLKLLHGTLAIESQPNRGTTIHACVPLPSRSDSMPAAS
jgi:PAS domain S-box-containing protein